MQTEYNTTPTKVTNTPWLGWNLESVTSAFCRAFGCEAKSKDDDPLSPRSSHTLLPLMNTIGQPEINATTGALRLAMKAAGVEPGQGCDWLSRRWPPVMRYYPYDLTTVCGGAGLTRRG